MKKHEILMKIYKTLERNIEKTNLFDNTIIIFFIISFTFFFIRLSEQGIFFKEIYVMDTILGLTVFTAFSISFFFTFHRISGNFPKISGMLIWIHGLLSLTGNPSNINLMQVGIFVYIIFLLIKIKLMIWELKGDFKSKEK